jgi:hypothetical protein
VAAGIGLAVLSGHHGHLPAIPGAVATASEHGILGCAGLEALWESAGGSRAAAFTAAEIAMAESSGRQYASLVNANGTTDRATGRSTHPTARCPPSARTAMPARPC